MGKDINDRVIGENEPLEFIKETPKKKPKVITYESVMIKRCASAVAMVALSVAIIVTAFVYGRGDSKIETDDGYKATTTTTTTVTTTSPTVLGGENSESETTVTTPADSEEVVVTTTIPKTESETPKTTTVPSVSEEKVTTTTTKATEKPAVTTVTTTKKTDKSTTTKAPTTTTTKKPTTTTTTKKQTTTTTTTKKQTTTTTTTKKPASQTNLSVSASIGDSWNDGTGGIINIDITNKSSSTKSGWTVTLKVNRSITITNAWGCEYSMSGNTITITPMSYTTEIPANGSISNNAIGIQYTSDGTVSISSVTIK